MLRKLWGHFKTVHRHRSLVFKYCRASGLWRQGLLHDLSKYSPEEFWTGVRYFQGSRSPNDAERQATGCSKAWLHHKGRNKHHLEYWYDYRREDGVFSGLPMPLPYLIESVCDRIAASRVYLGEHYEDHSPLDYYERSRSHYLLHEENDRRFMLYLGLLAEEGEAVCMARMKEDLRAYRREKKRGKASDASHT